MATETAEVLHHYNEDHNERSASVVIPYLLQFVEPRSVVDIGCGPGQWLSVLVKHGINEVTGVDGDHVPYHLRKIDNFIEFDLRRFDELRELLKPADTGKRFDLCICLEVAEHLPPECAQDFVAFLTELSDLVLFSAALPGQTGENHLNEQPQGYWMQLFKENRYGCRDLFRKKFWNDDSVNWWYRQNMFLFVHEASLLKLRQIEPLFYDGNQYIHPEMILMYVRKVRSLETSLASQPMINLGRLKSKVMFWKN